MTTVLGYVLGMILVGGVLFLLVSFVFGRGEVLAPMPPDSVPVELPDGRPAAAPDIHRLRLPVVLRGYRMYEVDWVLDRLAAELELRDAEIAKLRAALAADRGNGDPAAGERVFSGPPDGDVEDGVREDGEREDGVREDGVREDGVREDGAGPDLRDDSEAEDEDEEPPIWVGRAE